MSFIFGNFKFVSKVNSSTLRRTWVPHVMYKRFSSSYSKKLLRISNFVVQQRTYLWNGLSPKSSEDTFRKVDEIPEGFMLIYTTPSYKYYKWGYFLACVLSASVLGLVFYSFEYERSQIFLTKDKLDPMSNEIIFYLVAFTLFFIGVQSCTTQVPMRIYNSPFLKKYIFVFNGGIPLTLKKATCYKGEVIKYQSFSSITEYLPWNKCGYLLPNSMKVYLFEDSFRKPSDFHDMLGHQDDFDSE